MTKRKQIKADPMLAVLDDRQLAALECLLVEAEPLMAGRNIDLAALVQEASTLTPTEAHSLLPPSEIEQLDLMARGKAAARRTRAAMRLVSDEDAGQPKDEAKPQPRKGGGLKRHLIRREPLPRPEAVTDPTPTPPEPKQPAATTPHHEQARPLPPAIMPTHIGPVWLGNGRHLGDVL